MGDRHSFIGGTTDVKWSSPRSSLSSFTEASRPLVIPLPTVSTRSHPQTHKPPHRVARSALHPASTALLSGLVDPQPVLAPLEPSTLHEGIDLVGEERRDVINRHHLTCCIVPANFWHLGPPRLVGESIVESGMVLQEALHLGELLPKLSSAPMRDYTSSDLLCDYGTGKEHHEQ